MTALPTRSTREPGRRGRQGETRARLIQVTIELVRTEGLTALTTSRITRAAGIAQPGFYAHFKNVDDLVRTAVSQVLEEMRHKIGEVRQRAFERFKTVVDIEGVNATTRAAYEDTLEVFLSDPTFAELFLRYRRDPSLLGGYMRSAMDQVRKDVTEDVWRNARRLGFAERQYDQVAFWAEQILGLYFAAAEALLDGRYQDRALIVDQLTRSTTAILRAQVRAEGARPAEGAGRDRR